MMYVDVKNVLHDLHSASVDKFIELKPGNTWQHLPIIGDMEIIVEPYKQNYKSTVSFNVIGNDKTLKEELETLKGEYILCYRESGSDDWQVIGTKKAGFKFNYTYKVNTVSKGRKYNIEYFGQQPLYVSGPLLPRLCTYEFGTEYNPGYIGKSNEIVIDLIEPIYSGIGFEGLVRFAILHTDMEFILHYSPTGPIKTDPNIEEFLSVLVAEFNSMGGLYSLNIRGSQISLSANFTLPAHLVFLFDYGILLQNQFFEIKTDVVYVSNPIDVPPTPPTGGTYGDININALGKRIEIFKNNLWVDITDEYQPDMQWIDSIDTITKWRVMDEEDVINEGDITAYCKIK